MLVAALLALLPAALAFECSVTAFNRILPSNATTLFATHLDKNSTFGQSGDIAYPKNATNLPSLCVVSVNVTSSATSSFTFGLFLPDTWNGRFLAVGNGAFFGGINWLDMGAGVQYGFATISTNTGHNSSSTVLGPGADWALNQPEKKIDWAYRAMHGSVSLAKQVVQAYYSKPADYSYYSGCSTGGYQGLKEVQMFPNDFDGALVGAPAWWHSHLQTWTIWLGKYNLPVNASHHIPWQLFPVIQAEVVRQCDGVDGVVDGIISDPRACDFYPEALLCTSPANQTACLTSPQIGTLYKIYSDWVDTNQSFVFSHLELGTESQWALLNGTTQPDQLSIGYVQNLTLDDPTWPWQNISYNTVLTAEKLDVANSAASDFDIEPFLAHGGKLLHYHGYADGFIPTGSSRYYRKQVLRTLTPRGIDVDASYRFFLIPGMHHCSGSPAPVRAPWYIAGAGQQSTFSNGTYSVPGFEDADHDALLALVRWVESGDAPNSIVATKYVNDTIASGVQRQRPLCPFPQRAVWNGKGDVNNASSWYCSGC